MRAHPRAMGPARRLLVEIEERGHTLVLSEELLAEVGAVLDRPRLRRMMRLADGEIASHLSRLRQTAELVRIGDPRATPIRDPGDVPVLLTAVVGKVDVLCTLDAHFHEPEVVQFCRGHGILVMTDTQLLQCW